MVVRPEELQAARPEYISEDRKCVGCGYNLKGLKSSANCPECGRAIMRRRRGSRYADHLVHAPMNWLAGFKLGTLMMMLAAAAFVVATLAGSLLRRYVVGLDSAMLVGSTLAWWIGVCIVTRPRPVTAATTVDPSEEWFKLRLISRVSQAGWPVALVLGVIIARMNAAAVAAANAASIAVAAGAAAPPPVAGPPLALFWIAGLGSFIAAIGLVFLCIYLSNICFWAADTTLAINFRACAWTVTGAAVAGVLLTLNFVIGTMIATFKGTVTPLFTVITWPVMTAAGFFITVATLHLLWCLWRLQTMATWALLHNVNTAHQTDRLKERAERSEAAQRREARGRRER